MKKVILLLVTSLSLSTYSNFNIGRNLFYKSRVRGSQKTDYLKESITQRDEDFSSHYIEHLYNGHLTKGSWLYDGDRYTQLNIISNLYNNCLKYDGNYESMVVDNIPYITCKLNRVYIGEKINFFGNDELDFTTSVVWIGSGPYNGIFKVVNYRTNTMFQLASFK